MMADVNDAASEEEENERQARLEEHRRRVEKQPSDWDRLHCYEEDCEVEIPQIRLDYGFFRCVDCQTKLEKARKLKGFT
jgi:RNA polymerase-binding transcription factor DksA